MCGKFRKCDYCGHNEMINEQHNFMLGMDTAKVVCISPCEFEYSMFKEQLKQTIELMFNKFELDYIFYDCENCKHKYRSINSKKYFDKMLQIVNSDKGDEVDKLLEIYAIEDQYFKEFGGF